MMKTIHRIFAAVMVFCLCVTALPAAAFAAEDGLVTTANTTTGTVTDGEGNTVITVTVEKQTQGTTAEGVTVNREETRSDTTKVDPDGNVLSTSYVDEGSEEREWDDEVKPGEEMGEVKVELKPGESTSGSASETTEDITGDEQQGLDDEEYDFTKTETTIDRSVTAESSEVDINVDKVDTDLESIKPEDYEGKDPYIFGPDLDSMTGNKPQPEEEGYDYQLAGYGEGTEEIRVLIDYVAYKKADGEPVTDEDGNFVIEEIEPELGIIPTQIALRKDENGEYEYFFGYCVDLDTGTRDGTWYKVANLKDNDYYPDPDSAGNIRAVVTNGYWGTESGTGSIEQIKELIKEACGPDAVITVDTDDIGGKETFKIADIIDGLTESEALTATQAAIWSYANGESNTRDGKDGYIAHGPANVRWSGGRYVREYLPESDARAMAVFNWLRSLAPIADTEEDVTTIINDKNTFGDMWLTVQDKVEGYAQNTDENVDNDVYNSELNFTLAFVPDPEKDDLLVYLLDKDGNAIKDSDGEPIVRRLAGTNSKDRTADSIEPDKNGVYTLSGLQLSENSDFSFDLRLEGAQYLKEGVYIYTPHGGRDKSQSIVGIAEGTHTVDVSVSMTVSFDAEESKHVVAERVWRSQDDTQYVPTIPVPPVTNTQEVPPHLSKWESDIHEDVYIADPVGTGDASFALMGIAVISAAGLAGICLTGRKTKEN